MKVDVNGVQIDLVPNSRPYLLKRIAADGFDTFLIFVLFMLFTALILKTPAANVYHAHLARYQAIEAEVASDLGNDAEAVSEALRGNEEYLSERLAANVHSYLLKAAACFLAEGIILLAVPLFSRFRCTPGKLMTGIIPFYEQRQSRAVPWQVIARFVFVFLIDSLAWYLLTGILTFLLVPLLRLTEMLLNRKNKTICDWMTGVLVIEKLSYDGIN